MTYEAMRIHRALARAGVASRRKAEELVAAGRVKVNGVVAQTGQSVQPERDKITVDDKLVSMPKKVTWLVLHKPQGVLTSRPDGSGRKTVFDLVNDVPGLTYVGRLDYLTEGVLLMTTDGEAAHRLTHPSSEIERTYVVTVRGDVPTAVRRARAGLELEDGFVRPTHVDAVQGEDRQWLMTITIREGRTREVRRLCEALELEVRRLVRTQFGPVRLGTLQAGAARALTQREIELIASLGVDIDDGPG
jgi:pseudouridine synthase